MTRLTRGRRRARHAGLHGARSSWRRRSRRARRHLFVRRDGLGAGDAASIRSARIPRLALLEMAGAHGRAGGAAGQGAGRAGRDRHPLPARSPVGPLRLGRRAARGSATAARQRRAPACSCRRTTAPPSLVVVAVPSGVTGDRRRRHTGAGLARFAVAMGPPYGRWIFLGVLGAGDDRGRRCG